MSELQDSDSAEIRSEKVGCSSNMKPRLQAQYVVLREGLVRLMYFSKLLFEW